MSPSGGDGRSFQADADRPEATCLGAFAEVTFTDGRTGLLTHHGNAPQRPLT